MLVLCGSKIELFVVFDCIENSEGAKSVGSSLTLPVYCVYDGRYRENSGTLSVLCGSGPDLLVRTGGSVCDIVYTVVV